MGRAAAVSTTRALLVLCAAAFAPEASTEEPRGTAQAPGASAVEKQKPAPIELPPRAPIAGIRLLETTSTIVFADPQAKPHELVATFAFPARARLQLGVKQAEGTPRRELRYRAGNTVFAIGMLDSESSVLAGAGRLEVLRDLELRQAAFLWPDGIEWKSEDGMLTAPRGEIGRLRAHAKAIGDRPERLELLDAEGKELVSLRAIEWVEESGRAWPARFEFWRGGALTFRETVEARDTKRTYVDSYFLPADRRDAPIVADRMLGVVRDEDLPRFAARRVELAAGIDWKAATAEVERLKREWTEVLRAKGLTLEPNATVELGPKLEPRALLVRLAKEPAELPEGFAWTERRPGRVVFVDGLDQVPRVDLERLRAGLVPTARLAPLYARIPARAGPVLVVQPWTAGE